MYGLLAYTAAGLLLSLPAFLGGRYLGDTAATIGGVLGLIAAILVIGKYQMDEDDRRAEERKRQQWKKP